MEAIPLISHSYVYTMRQLNQNTAKVLEEINSGTEPALVTRHGRLIALITPLANERVEQAMLGAVLETAEYVGQLVGERTLSGVLDGPQVLDRTDTARPDWDGVYTMRQLNQNTAKVLEEINSGTEPALVTRRGRLIAKITPLANERVEQAVLGAVLDAVEDVGQLVGEQTLSEVLDGPQVAKEAGITYHGGYA